MASTSVSMLLLPDAGKAYTWPPASVLRVVDPGQIRVFVLTWPFGHSERSCMWLATWLLAPQDDPYKPTGMTPAVTHASWASLMLAMSSDC